MTPSIDENLISTKEASILYGYNPDYLARLCKAKKIRARQLGRTWLVDRASLEAFSKEQDERKVIRANALAHERSEERRVARLSFEPVKNSSIFNFVPRAEIYEHVTVLSSAGGHVVRLPRKTAVVAVLLSLIVFGCSAYASCTNIIPAASQNIIALAVAARAAILPTVQEKLAQVDAQIASAINNEHIVAQTTASHLAFTEKGVVPVFSFGTELQRLPLVADTLHLKKPLVSLPQLAIHETPAPFDAKAFVAAVALTALTGPRFGDGISCIG